jgi:ribonuclease P protein component
MGRARRWRRGPLWIRALPGPTDQPPRIAFAIGRTVGGAVVRNRLRRRLRALIADRADQLVPGGTYLIGAGPDACGIPTDQLAATLTELLGAVRQELR